MNRLCERAKVDIGLVAQAINNTNVTGPYFDMSDCQRSLWMLIGAAMAATKTSKIELLQAKDAAATGAKAITSASAEITANTLVTEATVTLVSVTAGETVTINGLTFTAHATTTTKANREFSIAGDDTADGGELAACINDATYGVPGVTASNAAGVVTLKATDPGGVTITTTKTGANMTLATTQAQAYVDLDTSELDLANGYSHVAAKVTTTANSVVAVSLLRYGERSTPTQKVGAYAIK